MIERSNNRTVVGRFAPNKKLPKKNRPFWLPVANFYILAAAIAIAVFFVTWAILNVGEEEMPLLSAGLLASAILAGAVVLREVIIRSARYRLILAQEKIDRNIKIVQRQNNIQGSVKLTIEENHKILKSIQEKSRAADGNEKSSENHRQIFELCREYLHRNEKELEFANFGSPRIRVLRDSRQRVQQLQKHHLLSWASLETRALMHEAKVGGTVAKKMESVNQALAVLDSAIEFYPDAGELLESAAAVREFSATIKISHWIEQAERAAFKQNYKRALSHYRDALFYLAREEMKTEEKDSIAEKINNEIEGLRRHLES